MPRNHEEFSMETILNTTKHDNASNWSQVWSTSHIPGMDRALGEGAAHGDHGRRKLRLGALALASCLAVQCRVAAFSLTGGYLIFILFLIIAVTMIANPMRHFEVYLGQWSGSGPGRAFRIIPVVDGIGIAICINALIRAIYCSTVAAIAGIYITHTVRDAVLPFNYCRDFQLNPYQPINHTFKNGSTSKYLENTRGISETINMKVDWIGVAMRKGKFCKESYKGSFPPLQRSPAYNYFYVEVMRLRKLTPDFGTLNIPLAINVTVVWFVMWMFILVEKIIHKRIIFNNIHNWFIIVPWLYVLLFLTITLIEVIKRGTYPNSIRIGIKEFYHGFTSGLEIAVYIHSASFGTEIIHGKGLHYYASGHIDPLLYDENIWHSVIMVVLAIFNATTITACALLCSGTPEYYQASQSMHESILWVMPMYSKCLSMSPLSHSASTVVFGGLMFSYTVVAYTMVKTALHTIFEYRVKLVFIEQPLVFVLVVCCLMLNLLFATGSGILLLESMDSISTGVTVPLICLIELIGILYVYRSTDFESDMDVATEENKCGYRIGMQWKMLPAITGVFLVVKSITLIESQMPSTFMLLGTLPLVAIVLSVPLRAACNSFNFFKNCTRKK